MLVISDIKLISFPDWTFFAYAPINRGKRQMQSSTLREQIVSFVLLITSLNTIKST